MNRFFPVLLCLMCFAARAEEPDASSVVLETLDRTIRSEPKYRSTPKYCLVVLGASGHVKVWLVEDGKLLFIDQNANGDLTDDGPPIEPSDIRQFGENQYDLRYLLDTITAPDGLRCTNFNLRRWNYGEKADSYGLSLSIEGALIKSRAHAGNRPDADDLTIPLTGALPMYAGWFGTFWSTKPATAPIVHFGGPLTPKMLREREFVIGSGLRRLSMALINPGSEPGAVSRLSIDALPAHVTPRLVIDWPALDKGSPLQTSHDLTSRCCYWEFYTEEFKVPAGIGVGTARVTVQFPGFKLPLKLMTDRMEVPVVERASKSKD